jgi:hypothetical protein
MSAHDPFRTSARPLADSAALTASPYRFAIFLPSSFVLGFLYVAAALELAR